LPTTQTEQIASSYRTVTIQGAWYGPAVAELLEKIPSELVTKALTPGAHTISDLLQHMLLWNERIRNTSDSTPLPRWEAEKEWAEPSIPWDELVTRWKQSRDQLEERIRNFPDQDLPKQVPGRDYPYEKLFRGAVQHVIYHSGQIAMLLSMIRLHS